MRTEAVEEGVLPTQLGPQRPGRVAQPHAGRPSRPRTDGHDSASPGRPTAWRHQGDQEWDLLDPGRGHHLPGLTTPRQQGHRHNPRQGGSPLRRQEDEDVLQYSDQANFVPFIVETGGRINAAGLQFLSRILPLEAEGTAGLTRRHGRAALRGISRALALQQGYMLAQITEEIHAPDRAAQDAEEGGNSEYQDLGLEVDDDDDPTDS